MLISLLSITACILLGLFGANLLQKVFETPSPKSKSEEFTRLISDGLVAYHKRVGAAVIQIIVYLILIFWIVALFKGNGISSGQVLAFAFGAALLSIATFVSTSQAPKTIAKILENNEKYVKNGLLTLLNASCGISFIIIGSTLSGLLFVSMLFDTETLIAFGVGICLAAVFLRIGSGMFKSTSDISADIVAKVERDIPDFDSRNPATVLDIIGDCIGNIIGFSSDIISSFVFVIIAAIVYAKSTIMLGFTDLTAVNALIRLPLAIICISVFASFMGYFVSVLRIQKNAINNCLLEGLYTALFVCAIITYFAIYMAQEAGAIETTNHLFIAYMIGLIGGAIIGVTSEYLTSYRFNPSKNIAKEVEYGPSISTLNGWATGLKSTALFTAYLLSIGFGAYYFAQTFGIAMAAIGMLSAISLLLSINLFSSIAGSTLKIQELTQKSSTTHRNCVRLAEIGENNKAIKNGFATAAAILATASLIFCIILENTDLPTINFAVLSGMVLGIAIPYTIAGFLANSLKQNILKTIEEVRRQFKDIPFLTENKAKPDMIKATDTQARDAMDSLIIPSIIMIIPAIWIAYFLDTHVLIGLCIGTFLSAAFQSFTLTLGGDALHNAKQYIANGHYGGKDSATFAHIQTADNIGDAWKDLLSPSMNILMKAITIITLLLMASTL